ncbi:phage minor structural protein [Streptomyces malaysiensis]|uniref:Phage minor structural protein n=2 Tax=Streptomyces malaysiensis TaxID=92644 RepID=A0A7X5XCD8_STRMQ|nr:phage minor structural protein [Streptomyces malaysiensis]
MYQAAPAAKADPLALLDSLSFRTAVEAIAPADTAALTAAITAAVTANPRLGSAPVPGPARGGGGEFNGPPAGDRKPASLADAIAAKFSG